MPKENTVNLKDITFLGLTNLPASSGCMIVPSQLNYHDLLRLETLLEKRSLIFIIEDGTGLHPQLASHLDREHVTTLVIVPGITDLDSYRAAMKDAMNAGSVVIYLPADLLCLAAGNLVRRAVVSALSVRICLGGRERCQ